MPDNAPEKLLPPSKTQASTPAPLPLMDRALNALEGFGIPRPFLNCTMVAAVKFASTYGLQPFHVIRQRKNAPGSIPESAFSMIMNLVKNGEATSLWRGVTTGATKLASREYYRFYGITEFKHKLTEEWLPKDSQKAYPVLVTGITAAAVSSCDVLFSSPFDRVINVKVTHEKIHKQIISMKGAYYQLPEGQRFKALYAGWRPYLANQTISWGGFLALHDEMAEQLTQRKIPLTTENVFLGDIAIGVALSPLLNPLDVIRHQQSGIAPIPAKSILGAARHIYANQGLRAFGAGTPQRMMANVISTVITGGFMNYVEAREREKKTNESGQFRG